VTDWLSFFCFTTFTDRDGKYQLRALAESGFDPLARTCRSCSPRRPTTCSWARRAWAASSSAPCRDDEAGGRPQEVRAASPRHHPAALNLWYSLSVDLFGGEDSSNAATFFGAGLKGRDREGFLDEHTALEQSYKLTRFRSDGTAEEVEIPLRRAMNEVLRDAYIEDCEKVVKAWNRTLQKEGVGGELTLPSRRFHRFFDPQGNFLSYEAFEAQRDAWLPGQDDKDYLHSIMDKAHTRPGEFADWIAPPKSGINGQPVDFDYVKFNPA
jgi:benzoyl-CoA 2,3-dioxygenase component B